MSTVHHPNKKKSLSAALARCLRHHVWMAACSDCRAAHVRPSEAPGDPDRRAS